MGDKVFQTKEELKKHFLEQIGFLEKSADSFDSGYEDEAKRLAVVVRVLLHDTSSSRSLIGQLEMNNKNFLDTSWKFSDDENIKIIGSIINLASQSLNGKYVAMLDDMPLSMPKWVDFNTYWEMPIIIDNNGDKFSRKELICYLANQDGGAHVDPGLDNKYFELSRKNSLGWKCGDDNNQIDIKGAELACVRQIAHEILKTFKQGYCKKPKIISSCSFGGMVTFKRIDTKVGRNDPCSCGSGKKYKKCCGK